MGFAQKVALGLIGLGMLTTVSLPKRQFDRVVLAVGNAGSRLLGTAMGTRTT